MPNKITAEGFLSEFLERHNKLSDRPFCWVLGSGASVQSGIPTGEVLAMRWLKELHEREDFEHLSLQEWSTPKNLGIKGFTLKNVASFYPFIYQRRFRDFEDLGYAFLEDSMGKAEPSYGYSVLAQIMTQTRHNVSVTTNFDNLIADAISIYARVCPLVCGHELLTGFIRAGLKRPVIAKIHRDLLFNPKSTPAEIEKLPPEWEAALRTIFANNTPIVIGYGGNDGSLMGLLKDIAPIKGGIFWCYKESHEPNQAIQDVVERHRGRLVPVEGFDELMLRFATKLALPSPIPELNKAHALRIEQLTKQFTDLEAQLKQSERIQKALREHSSGSFPWRKLSESLVEMTGMLSLNQKIQQAKDLEARETIYRDEIKSRQDSAWFWNVFGDFLWKSRGKVAEAHECFQKALELEPENVTTQKSYQEFSTMHPQFGQ